MSKSDWSICDIEEATAWIEQLLPRIKEYLAAKSYWNLIAASALSMQWLGSIIQVELSIFARMITLIAGHNSPSEPVTQCYLDHSNYLFMLFGKTKLKWGEKKLISDTIIDFKHRFEPAF